MTPFDYQRATTIDAALTLIEPGAAFLAGGTNLVDHLRLGVRQVGRLVDVSRLDFGGVDVLEDGGVRIGANVRNSDLAMNAEVRRRFPLVSEALLAGASGQLRNMATTGGNLLQRTRCVYFQDLSTPCNKRDPGSGCSAIDGFGRYNALLGTSPSCVAVHPSDLCVPLAALEAIVHVVGRDGERSIPFAGFHRLPGDTPDRDTNLDPGELVTAIEIPPLAWATRSTYRKVRDRASYAFALISVAAAVDVDQDHIRDVRLGLGGVSHKPHRAVIAESMLRNEQASTEVFRAAIDAELADARPGTHNAFKLPLVRNTVVDVLHRLTSGGER